MADAVLEDDPRPMGVHSFDQSGHVNLLTDAKAKGYTWRGGCE